MGTRPSLQPRLDQVAGRLCARSSIMASNSKADIKEISGPSSMAKPGTASNPQSQTQSAEQSTAETGQSQAPPGKPKKKRPRGGKNRRKNRKQSFVAPSESNADESAGRTAQFGAAGQLLQTADGQQEQYQLGER